MAGYFNFDTFCKGLHGLTQEQIKDEIESKDAELERMERTARNKRRKRPQAGQVPPPNYRPDIEAIGRLAQYVLYGGVPRDMPEHEIELAKEVLRNMKTTKKKS